MTSRVTQCGQSLFNTAVITFLLVAFGTAYAAQRTLTFPGAKGPRMELSPSAAGNVQTIWAAVLPDNFDQVGSAPKQADREKPLPQVFASGTKALYFFADFKQSPPSGTTIGVAAACSAGAIVYRTASLMTAKAPSGEMRVMMLRTHPNGVYPDGPCQATILVDEKAVAKLNFSIGTQ